MRKRQYLLLSVLLFSVGLGLLMFPPDFLPLTFKILAAQLCFVGGVSLANHCRLNPLHSEKPAQEVGL